MDVHLFPLSSIRESPHVDGLVTLNFFSVYEFMYTEVTGLFLGNLPVPASIIPWDGAYGKRYSSMPGIQS